jgi:hypothetical protein
MARRLLPAGRQCPGGGAPRARRVGPAARAPGRGGRPAGIYLFSTCADTIRTLLALTRSPLQHEAGWPEDVDNQGEDHAADEVRYACMSRPFCRGRWRRSALAVYGGSPDRLVYEAQAQPDGRMVGEHEHPRHRRGEAESESKRLTDYHVDQPETAPPTRRHASAAN